MTTIQTIKKSGSIIFGIELTGLQVMPATESSDPEKFASKMISQQMDFAHSLHELSEEFSIELRYFYDPANPYKIHVYFLVQFKPGEEETPKEATERFSACILNLMDVNFPIHEFTAINDKPRLKYLIFPFEFNHIAEIVRREDIVPLDTIRKTANKAIGFGTKIQGNNPKEQNDAQIYHVFPFLLPLDNRERLCSALFMQHNPCIVSICLRPYGLTETDEKEMENHISSCEKYSQISLGSTNINEVDTLRPFLNKQAARLYENCSDMLTSLQDAAFLKKVQLASNAPLSPELINTCGASFTEHTGHPKLFFQKGNPDRFAGGYDWHIPATKKQLSIARANLKNMDFEIWIPSQAPPQLRHWRYLFDISQSTAAFRLPFPKSAEYPGINTYQHHPKMAPSDMPSSGLHIGNHFYMNRKRQVYFNTPDRRRHAYVIGQTGTGKSTLFYHMIMQDIENGHGVGVIDPHENLIDDILKTIPRHRLDDVVLFDPTDREYPIGLNPLHVTDAFEKDFSVNYLIEIFDTLYNLRETGGPMFEMYMRNALLLLLEQPEDYRPSILDVPKMFQNEKFRRQLIKKCQNPYVVNFWKEEAEQVFSDASLKNIAPYITSKLSRFIYNDLVRGIFGQRQSALNFKDLMDDGKIFLVNLSKGQLGQTNSHFLGMILIGKLFTGALRRDGSTTNGLRDFFLYVDEFQNLATPTFASILSESRKYRLSLTLTNQYISQLYKMIQEGILGNVGTLVSLRVGFDDAEVISNELSRLVSPADLMGLSNYEAYLRLLIDGSVSAPFNIKTVLPEYRPAEKRKKDIQKKSRQLYGRPRKELEEEIQENWRPNEILD